MHARALGVGCRVGNEWEGLSRVQRSTSGKF